MLLLLALRVIQKVHEKVGSKVYLDGNKCFKSMHFPPPKYAFSVNILKILHMHVLCLDQCQGSRLAPGGTGYGRTGVLQTASGQQAGSSRSSRWVSVAPLQAATDRCAGSVLQLCMQQQVTVPGQCHSSTASDSRPAPSLLLPSPFWASLNESPGVRLPCKHTGVFSSSPGSLKNTKTLSL